MGGILIERLRQGRRTIRYPRGAPPPLPDRWRGRPEHDPERCDGCRACGDVCPTGALASGGRFAVDMAKCLFCGACAEKCPRGALSFTKDFALSSFDRAGLIAGRPPGGAADGEPAGKAGGEERLARIRSLFGRSLKLRQVSAGGCNACEADCNVLTTIAWDMGRFGIQFVAAPRHADGVLVTGPVTANMRLALDKTYAAVPEPKVVIAVGACAASGGVHSSHPGGAGLDAVMPVDLYIPGCPPHPLVILEGLLRLLGRV